MDRRALSGAPGLAARAAALALLQAVLWHGEPLDRALARAFRKLEAPADRGLARAIAGAVLRRLPDLDALIDSATRRNLPDDARARMVLRTALAQALVLRTPAHAVIATALPLLEGGPRRLAHGVLSALLKRAAALPDPPSLPQPWEARWRARWGAEVVGAASTMLTAEPDLDLTLRAPETTADWARVLGGRSLMPGHVRLPAKGRIEDLPGYAEGAWWVQDLAAALPARLLRPRPGERIADLCAAPGGKTMQLAAAGAMVSAVDISPGRLARVGDNLARTRLTAMLAAADALKWQPPEAPHKLLLDAPCLGTGIFRRHPDVLHIKSARQAEALAAQQAALLDRAATLLRPGGLLVYCVCSLEAEEGEAQVEALLERRADLVLDAIDAGEIVPGLTPDRRGWLRILPGDLAAAGGLDGFFMARLAKA